MIGDINSINNDRWLDMQEYQLQNFYRDIKQKENYILTEDELFNMIERFKIDISTKNISESSCLYQIQKKDQKRFDEIKSDLEYIDKQGLEKPIKNFLFQSFLDKQSYSIGARMNYISIAFYVTPLINALIRVGTMEEKENLFLAFIDGEKIVPSTKRGEKGMNEKFFSFSPKVFA